MPFLLRVSLPDVPGSLGRLASAIGSAGGDIDAIEIVEKRHADTGAIAVDDVLLELTPGTMPDTIVSACNALDGVEVQWISAYAAGGNLVLDLEAVEMLTAEPGRSIERLVEILPDTFRLHWAARVHRTNGIVTATQAAPTDVRFTDITHPTRLEAPEHDVAVYAAAALNDDEIVVVGRRGGPEFIDSEIARLGHLVGLAAAIQT